MQSHNSNTVDTGEAILCQSFCHHCKNTSDWKVKKVTDNHGITELSRAATVTCEHCNSPLDVDDNHVLSLDDMDDCKASTLTNEQYLYRAMRIQKQQEAFASTARMNWFEASQM